jgi:hypothetical protein
MEGPTPMTTEQNWMSYTQWLMVLLLLLLMMMMMNAENNFIECPKRHAL